MDKKSEREEFYESGGAIPYLVTILNVKCSCEREMSVMGENHNEWSKHFMCTICGNEYVIEAYKLEYGGKE